MAISQSEIDRLVKLAEEKGGTLAVVDTKDWQLGEGKDIFESVYGDFETGFVIQPKYCHVIALAEAAGDALFVRPMREQE